MWNIPIQICAYLLFGGPIVFFVGTQTKTQRLELLSHVKGLRVLGFFGAYGRVPKVPTFVQPPNLVTGFEADSCSFVVRICDLKLDRIC